MRLTIAENAVELGEKAADFAAKMINQYIARRNRARVVLSADASQFEFLDALAKKEVDWSKVEFFPLNEYVGLPIDHPASFRQCIKERFAVRPEAVHSVSPEGNAEESLAALTEKLNEAPIDLAFVDVGENGRIALNAPPADLDCEDAYIIVGQAVSMTVKQIMRAKTILSAVPHAVKAQAIKATLEAKETTPLVPATVLKERGWSLYIDKNSASLIDPDEYILKEEDLPRRELAPEDGHYFFGYYDLQPYDSKGKRHLCHKVRFADRLPEADDIAELGYIDLETESFHKIAETTAWNFQQGALLQWYDDDRIIYNVRTEKGFQTAVTHCKSGETRLLPLPSAHVSADRRHSLSVNFSRIFDFRPGYGYAGIPDPVADVKAPANDGVWLQDLKTGETKLIVTYKQIAKQFHQPPHSEGKLVVNHITFNPKGDRFMMLVRDFPEPPRRKHETILLTSDLEGNLFNMTDFSVLSHYHWKNDREMVMYYSNAANDEKSGLYLMKDLTKERTRIPEPMLAGDTHCLYSPDRRFISGDGYPDIMESKRSLYLYDTKTGKIRLLARPYSAEFDCTDLRCDLHARWSPDGKKISFDSNANGRRTIVELDLTKLLEEIKNK